MTKFCETRWSEQYEAVQSITENIFPIVNCLESISRNQNSQLSSQASELLFQIRAPEALFPLFVARKILSICKPLVMKLQSTDMNIFDSIDLITLTCNQLSMLIEGTDNQQSFNTLYTGYVKAARQIEAFQNRRSLSSTGEHQKALRTEYFMAVSKVKEDLLTRVGKNEREMATLSGILGQCFGDDKIKEMLDKFGTLLDIENTDSNVESVSGELAMFKLNFPEMRDFKLAIKNCQNFPLLSKIFRLVCVATSSNATSERSFSGLRRIKTFNRARMTEERLTSISIMAMNPDVAPSPEEVFEEFLHMKTRKFG